MYGWPPLRKSFLAPSATGRERFISASDEGSSVNSFSADADPR
jgi:hypothetical protein